MNGNVPDHSERHEAIEPYSAYAVAADGSRCLLDARQIVVELGHSRFLIDLRPKTSMMVGKLRIAAEGDAYLLLGPGDASSICLSLKPFRTDEGERGSSS
jgi:hypothetical protein